MKKHIFITKEILEKEGACDEWMKFFNKRYPNGVNPFDITEIEKFTKYIKKMKLPYWTSNRAEFYWLSLLNITWYAVERKIYDKLNKYLSIKRGSENYTIDRIKNIYLDFIKENNL